MRLWNPPGGAIAVWTLLLAGPCLAQTVALNQPETLTFGVEWRFVRAGEVQLKWSEGDRQLDMLMKSVGLVATLFTVNDSYRAMFDHGLCATSITWDVHEGRRNREVKATFDRTRKRSTFLEKDLNTNTVALAKEIDIPACVHDATGGLHKLRQLHPAPGSVLELPISDGKKVVMARVEAQQKETIKTPLGQFPSTRYEAFLFNGVMYGRKGRLFIWISDDDKRLPVQIRIQLPFYVGTLTLQLEKTQ
ncbi:DUF3108 domain-containing protein [Paludibaculum fermentans]|uniref:DUF3108 domain-containing protein n=1 Tax=Paludibaculum fermentans TaxID=1473598 RepID=A0A7S7SK18_PALFE|nr:DUF3108 domain-containing protein [Paludibaculum fermentans]QOY87021.1 DUF3108 domain-containing protein [Paludibaculum fermentans]